MSELNNNAIEEILARESAGLEETKRVNADREIMKALAPQSWGELKAEVSGLCSAITERAHTLELECEERSANVFRVNRVIRGTEIPALTFNFYPNIPAIQIDFDGDSRRKNQSTILFVLSGHKLFYTIDGRGLVLRQFVYELIRRLTRV